MNSRLHSDKKARQRFRQPEGFKTTPKAIFPGTIPGWDFDESYQAPEVSDEPLCGESQGPPIQNSLSLVQTSGTFSHDLLETLADDELDKKIAELLKKEHRYQYGAPERPIVEFTARELNQEMVEKLNLVGRWEEAQKMEECGTHFLVLRNLNTSEFKGLLSSCGQRYCWMCSRRRQERLQRLYVPLIEAMKYGLALTLTQVDIPEEGVREASDRFRLSMDNLRKDKGWRHFISGGMYSIELLPRPKGWHVHCHAAIDSNVEKLQIFRRLERDVAQRFPGDDIWEWSSKKQKYREPTAQYERRLYNHVCWQEEMWRLRNKASRRAGRLKDPILKAEAEAKKDYWESRYYREWTLTGAWYKATKKACGRPAYNVWLTRIWKAEKAAKEIVKYITKPQELEGDQLREICEYFEEGRRKTVTKFGWCFGAKDEDEEEDDGDRYEFIGTSGHLYRRIHDKIFQMVREKENSDWFETYRNDALVDARALVSCVRAKIDRDHPDSHEDTASGWTYHCVRLRREVAEWPRWLYVESGAEQLLGIQGMPN